MTAIAAVAPSAARFPAGLFSFPRSTHAPAAPSVPGALDLAATRVQALAWIALRGLQAAAPLGLGEVLLISLAQALYADVTAAEMRRAAEHLVAEGLARRDDTAGWHVVATARGLAAAASETDAPQGIGPGARFRAS
ncbi:hypothetical protein EAT51_12005 [Pseudoxanthomonas winnipegensis]|uniref:hypothetical protein n=1 Tax=Pseudoxanthomonas winnipegensis TaxID=2480810 RepID=UPI00102DC14B|nr:hypothetical protein [Pseudoxanthomonas winnipegensis]TAA40695.1 hypothetical protein EAT51_12005 [Pseudoxanthomonas winnipegensis]